MLGRLTTDLLQGHKRGHEEIAFPKNPRGFILSAFHDVKRSPKCALLAALGGPSATLRSLLSGPVFIVRCESKRNLIHTRHAGQLIAAADWQGCARDIAGSGEP
jgi:hypothetical protein